MALTKRQREVYDFIKAFIECMGYSPSFEEIGESLELSSLATVHKHISNLESKGLLKRDYNRSRSIELIQCQKPNRLADRHARFVKRLTKYLPIHHKNFEAVASDLWRAAN